MARGYIAAFVALVALLVVSPAQADSRVALVIGNGKYQNVPFLPNPVNDAADITGSLKRLGFSVKTLTDTRAEDMRRALREFGQQARNADMAVMFFAGHGMEIGGRNWLIPVDAELRNDTDAENEAISLTNVTDQVGYAHQLGLVILDACRNNPFAAKMNRVSPTRAVERGFVRVEPAKNVLVAYAAKDGTTASDGNGRNSPFTAALLKNIETPGMEIQFVFRSVRDDVLASTKEGQQPFVYGSLSKEAIYLKAAKPGSALRPADDVAQAWAATQGTTNPALLEDFINRYADSYFASLARARLEELRKQQTALVAPPQAPAPELRPTVTPAPAPAGDCAGSAMNVALSSRPPCPLSQAEERALKPKGVFKECADCPEMVVVPAGRFTMGSPESEAGRSDDEGPQHEVTIAGQFAVGKFHVTVDQYKAFVAATGYVSDEYASQPSCFTFENGDGRYRQGRSWRFPGHAQTGSHPALCLNYDDAKAYVEWVAEKTGKPYRLLSEAEWEYSARAGTTTRYFFGNDEKDLCRYGNGASQSPAGNQESNRPLVSCDPYSETSPVGSFLPNQFGLYDMLGNARQWVKDCWNANYVGAPTDGSAQMFGRQCDGRVLRGGSWLTSPKDLRVADRGKLDKNYYDSTVGMRIARTLAP